MLRAVARCEKEESAARVVCSTAHKAKGREWRYVRVDPDFDSAFQRVSKAANSPGKSEDKQSTFEAEARLLYVAMTRAKIAVHLPRGVMSRFELKSTTTEILGEDLIVEAKQDTPPATTDESQSEVISPYHSPRRGESREMAALRRFLG